MLNIKCQRVTLKRSVAIVIAFIVFMILEFLRQNSEQSFLFDSGVSIIVLFVMLAVLSYLRIFNEDVLLRKDDTYVFIIKRGKEKKYRHEGQGQIKVVRNELLLGLPKREIRFVLSHEEKDIICKVKEWNETK